jgi:hypothetical protein
MVGVCFRDWVRSTTPDRVGNGPAVPQAPSRWPGIALPPSRLATVGQFPARGREEPGEAAQVQTTPLRDALKVSVTVAPVTALGPALVTVIT